MGDARTSIKTATHLTTMHFLSPMYQHVLDLSGIMQAWCMCRLNTVFGVGVDGYGLSNSEYFLAGG